MRDTSQQIYKKTLSHILLHVFYLYFLRSNRDFFRRGFESVRPQFLSVESSIAIYLFNHDSSKSTIFILTFWICHLTFFWMLSLPNKLESFVSCNINLFPLCFDMYFFYENLIIIHHGDNNFLFWHRYQIHTFNNNLNEEEW